MMRLPKIALHVQIVISMLGSVAFAILYSACGWEPSYVVPYLKTLAVLFLNSLKLVVVPLIMTSLIVSVNSVENLKTLSRLGGITMVIYLLTTIFSVSLGLLIGNVVGPGRRFPDSVRLRLIEQYKHGASPIPPGGQLIPDNLFKLLQDNNNLLKIVIFSILIGVALLQLAPKQKGRILELCSELRELFLHIMQWMMCLAPVGIFSIITSQLIEIGAGNTGNITDYLLGLLPYVGCVVGGLAFMMFVVYPLVLKVFTQLGWWAFIKAIQPAQLVAFSASSGTAALGASIRQVATLGIPKEVSNFVLSLGTIVNLNGTAVYQGVATMFIAQAFGVTLSWQQQLTVVGYVTIASIGMGGVASASLTSEAMLIEKLHINATQGIALICLPERLLDMCRSAANITGDAMVAVLVGRRFHDKPPTENQKQETKP